MAAQVQKLEQKLTASPSDPNPLLPLLALARNPSPEVVHKACWALYRVFGTQLAQNRVGGITGRGDESPASLADGAREVKGWVRERLLEYVAILGGLLCDSEPSLRASGLQLLFALLPPLSESAGVPVHLPYFRILLRHLLNPTPSLRGARTSSSGTSSTPYKIDKANQESDGILPEDVVESVIENYWAKYDDLRLFFFRETSASINATEVEEESNVFNQLLPLTNLPKLQGDINTFFLPSMMDAPKPIKSKKKKTSKKELDALPDWMETYESDSDSDSTPQGKRKRASALGTQAAVHSLAAHTNAYTDIFESVLFRLPLPPGTTRSILSGLHGDRGILSHWAPTRRVSLADWLGTTVDEGGPHAMLAMNGLFVLMTTYNLDYPRFYDRLYALLDANVLHVRYRARFFRLLDTFLRSPLLSASLIASFIKRLARLALTAPPAGIIMVIPFVYNLFKRHPGTMVLLHRLEDESNDPYDDKEDKVMHTKAIESSAWELGSLKDHYLASIATLAKVFGEQFTKPEFNLEDFLDHGYATLFDTEAQRKIRNPPALSVQLELGGEVPLFPGGEGERERDAVSELWAF